MQLNTPFVRQHSGGVPPPSSGRRGLLPRRSKRDAATFRVQRAVQQAGSRARAGELGQPVEHVREQPGRRQTSAWTDTEILFRFVERKPFQFEQNLEISLRLRVFPLV